MAKGGKPFCKREGSSVPHPGIGALSIARLRQVKREVLGRWIKSRKTKGEEDIFGIGPTARVSPN
jgi:hypothetical protein